MKVLAHFMPHRDRVSNPAPKGHSIENIGVHKSVSHRTWVLLTELLWFNLGSFYLDAEQVGVQRVWFMHRSFYRYAESVGVNPSHKQATSHRGQSVEVYYTFPCPAAIEIISRLLYTLSIRI